MTRKKPLDGKRVAVLTTGHLATSPRMTKAADAIAEAGATVYMVSTRSTPWALAGDTDIIRRRPGAWQWHVIDYRKQSRAIYLKSGVRQKLALGIARRMNPDKLPLYVAGSARERVFPEVVSVARRLDVDFVYGGGAGLAAAYFAARAMRIPFGVDLEDFHTGDQSGSPMGRLVEAISGRIERTVLPNAALRTAGSKDIAHEYSGKYGLDFVAIDNAFALEPEHRSISVPEKPLTLYWVSQIIGPDRGLEDAVRAVSNAGIQAELHLQGTAIESFIQTLRKLAQDSGAKLSIINHDPCNPDEIVSQCSRYDIGLALERSCNQNKNLCLSNKALAYVAAGMAVVLTDTRGQRTLADSIGNGAFVYREGDAEALARQLTMWDRDRAALQQAKDATYEAAKRRWNWDNPEEKGKLVESVAHALGIHT